MAKYSKGQLFALFALGCFPVRLILAFAGYFYSEECDYSCRVIGGIIALFVSFTFLKQYFNDAPGAFSGEKAWWTELRVLHAIIYSAVGLLLWSENNYWWFLLFFDLFIGTVATIIHWKRKTHVYVDINDAENEKYFA